MNLRSTSSMVFAALMLLMTATSCGRHTNLDPYGWESIGEPFDSLTMLLEKEWYGASWVNNAESSVDRRRQLTLQLREAATRSGNNEARARADFWEARIARNLGDSIANAIHFKNALELNDSAAYPYIRHRIQWLLDDDYPDYTLENYNHIKAQAEFFEQSGDRMMAGARWMDLGNFLNELGLTRRAIAMYDRSDSILRLAGFDDLISSNILNRAKALFYEGRKDEGEHVLRAALTDSVFADNDKALNILLEQLYVCYGDTAAMFQAREMLTDESQEELGAQAYFDGAISAYYLNRGQLDSAMVFSDRSIARLPDLYFPEQRTDVLAWRAEVLMAAGREKEAAKMTFRRLEEQSAIDDTTRRDEVMAQDFKERLEMAERADDNRVYRARMVAVVIVAAALLLICIGYFLLRRHTQKLKLAAMQQQLDLEKSQRRVLAIKLALDEKEQLLATIREQLAEASGDDIRAARLESMLKAHSAGLSDERATFMQTFTEVNPDFERKLREISESLTASDIRLASMISVGLTNKQIAAALGVRPESVKQARWRLRSKLGLDRDTSLEAFLASTQ